MYKMDKVYSFHISVEEQDAIKELRRNGINVSSFLRRKLRKCADRLILKNRAEFEGGIFNEFYNRF